MTAIDALRSELHALLKGRRLPGHVERRDKRGRRYWGPPDTGPVAAVDGGHDVHHVLDALEDAAPRLGPGKSTEAADRSHYHHVGDAIHKLLEHVPLDKLRQIGPEHRAGIATELAGAPLATHKRLAKKWKTPRTPAADPETQVRWDNVKHLNFPTNGPEGKVGQRIRVARALLQHAELPDDARDHVHGRLAAALQAVQQDRAVKVKRRKRTAAPDTSATGPGYGIEHHETHLRAMEGAARAAGHHDYADDLAAARVHATHGPVHEQIRAAYRKLSGGDGERHVSLADLRDHLHPDVSRSHVDRALTHGFVSGGIHLRPNENTKAITPREHAASIPVGGTARHFVRVTG